MFNAFWPAAHRDRRTSPAAALPSRWRLIAHTPASLGPLAPDDRALFRVLGTADRFGRQRAARQANLRDHDRVGVGHGDDGLAGMPPGGAIEEAPHSIVDLADRLAVAVGGIVVEDPAWLVEQPAGGPLNSRADLVEQGRVANRRAVVRGDQVRRLTRSQHWTGIDRSYRLATQRGAERRRLPATKRAQREPGQPAVDHIVGVMDIRVADEQDRGNGADLLFDEPELGLR